MGLPPLPRVLDLVALSDEEVSLLDGVGPAFVQDSWWELELQVLDEYGDPFDVTLWTFECELREAVYDDDGGVADMELECVGVGSTVTLSARPSQTSLLLFGGGRWDVQMSNAGDLGFDPEYRVVLFRGRWGLIQDVTRV